jgi:inner membrane protein
MAGGILFALLFKVKGYAIPLAIIGSVFPDIDLKFSKFIPDKGEKVSLWNTHRGFTHHPIIVFFLFLLWFYLSYKFPQWQFYWEFLYAFAVGYLSHLVLDSFTQKGIPIGLGYYPRFSLKLMKTGGIGEKILFLLLILSIVLYTLYLDNFFTKWGK